MKVLVFVAILVVGALLINAHDQRTTPQGETNGQRWIRMCAVEAPGAIDDCVTKHALGVAFERSNADYARRLRDASK